MKGNVIQMNTLHLNSVRLNGIGEVQSVSLKGGSTEDPVFPPVEPPVEPTPTYTLSASVTNGKVSAKRNGSAVNLPFTANEGDVIIVEVQPNDGYTFEGWNDGSTDNPRSITMTADVVLSAQCVEVVQPPVGNYIQFEDAEVERVLMSKGVSSDGVGITIEDAEKVTSISTWFKGNTAITSFEELVYFVNVTTLAYNAFSGCSSLTFIDLANIISLGGGTFYNCKKLATANLVIIRNIASDDFFGCSALAEDLNLPYLETVGSAAFKNSGITSIIAPSIRSMGYNSFSACKALRNIDLGSNLTTSGESTFYGCSALEIFICRATTPPTIKGYYLYGTSCPIYVPDSSLEAYKTAVNWSAYADRIHPLSEIEGSLVFYDKLVGDGTAYINTEYMPKGTDAFAWDAAPGPNANRFIWGMRASNISLGALYYSSGQSYYLAGAATSYNVKEDNSTRFSRTMLVRDDGEVYSSILVSENGETILATSSKDKGYATKTSDKPIYIFAAQKSTADISPDRRYTGAIYSFVITDIDDNTIMSLRPCTWNGEAGMWDEVGNKFYGNAATSGEFSVAND